MLTSSTDLEGSDLFALPPYRMLNNRSLFYVHLCVRINF